MKGKIFNTFFSKFFSGLFNFLAVVAISRALGATGKGEATLLITNITLILIACNFVGGATLVYLTPRYSSDSILKVSYLWSVLVCLAAFLFMYTQNGDVTIAIHTASLTLIHSLLSINLSILIGRQLIGYNNLLLLLRTGINLLVLLSLFFVLSWKVNLVFVLALYISFGISFLVSLILVLKPYRQEQLEASLKQFFQISIVNGFWNQWAHITQFLSFRLSYYLIEKYWGTATLGIYSNGTSLVESIWLISQSIALVQYASIANTVEKEFAVQTTVSSLKLCLMASVLCLIPLLLVPPSVYAFIFGEEFGLVKEVMIYMAPGVIFFTVANITGHYFSGTGRLRYNAIASSIGLMVTLSLAFILVPLFPLMGAALTSSFSYLVTAIFLMAVFKKESGLKLSNLLFDIADIKMYINSVKNLRIK